MRSAQESAFWGMEGFRSYYWALELRSAVLRHTLTPRFVKDMTKTFWCVFRFTVLTAVHLQNANAKFHKVE